MNSEYEEEPTYDMYKDIGEELERTVRTVLGMALEDMQGNNEESLKNELLEGDYGVEGYEISNEEGLSEFTFNYDENSNITIATLIESRESEAKAVVSYIESGETRMSSTITVEPC